VRWSVLIVAALVAIGIAASIDGLRGSSEKARTEAGGEKTNAETSATTAPTPTPAEVLARAGVDGTLYFTLEAEEGCVLHTLALPGLEGANASLLDRCEFDVSPRGDIVSGGPCPATDMELRPVGGPERHVRGCAPAWTPAGELTFVRGGDVLTLGGGTFVHDLARSARLWFSRREPVRVSSLAWLSERRLAALLTGRLRGLRVPGDLLVVSNGDTVLPFGEVSAGASIYTDRSLGQLWVAQPGSDLSARGTTVFTGSGSISSTTCFQANVNGFAALGDRWYALARPDNVCIYERRNPPPREEFPLTCLPFDVVDIGWIDS
jgi:hypothetical protein